MTARGNSMAKRLTARAIEQAKPVAGKRIEIPDAGKPGLYMVIQASGAKSWAVRYRRLSDGKPRKYTLDGFPSLAVAHKLAQAALDRVAEGGDPAAEKRAERQVRAEKAAVPSDFESVVREFLRRHTRKRNGEPIRESTKLETARLFGLKPSGEDAEPWKRTGGGVLARWKGKDIASITKTDVRDLLDDIAEAGPVTANRTLAALRTFFSWCVDRDRLVKSPCVGIADPSPEKPRDRVLSDAELAALWRAADSDGYAYGRMVQLLVLSGCRRDEVRDAAWSEFDLANRAWLIPGARTKNGRDHFVPLSDAAVAILEALPRVKGKAGLLFTTTGETPISGLSKAKLRLETAMTKALGAEPERWTLHDCRRTCITGLQRLGFPMEVAEAVANHKGGTLAGVAGIYGRHDYAAEKRTALDAWARHVLAMVDNAPSGEVIQLRPRAVR